MEAFYQRLFYRIDRSSVRISSARLERFIPGLVDGALAPDRVLCALGPTQTRINA